MEIKSEPKKRKGLFHLLFKKTDESEILKRTLLLSTLENVSSSKQSSKAKTFSKKT